MRALPVVAGTITVVLVVFLIFLYTGAGTCTQMGCIHMLAIEFSEPPNGFLLIETRNVTLDECDFSQPAGNIMRSERTYTLFYTTLGLSYPNSFEDGITISTRNRCSEEPQERARFSLEDIERTTINPNGRGCPGTCINLRIRIP